MLAALPPAPVPMPNASNLDVSESSSVHDPSVLTENRSCPGCKKSVVDENGGVVVAFGQSFFHVDCFKCAKCGNQVTADTNLLLLSDGSPICANCSYCCNVCKLPILDEAIMTGEDSYHAHCFKCKVCKNRIDELVFAKTSQGIYCMNCHNQRVARSRRHAQRQREKEKEREREREKAANALLGAGAVAMSTPGRSREEVARTQPSSRTSASQSPGQAQSPMGSSESSTASPLVQSQPSLTSDSRASNSHSSRRVSTSSVPGKQDRGRQEQTNGALPSISTTLKSSPAPLSISKRPSTSSGAEESRSSLVRHSSLDPAVPSSDPPRATNSTNPRMDSLIVPSKSDGLDASHPRKSFNGGVRPHNIALRPSPSNVSLSTVNSGTTNGLSVPNGDSLRRDKRRSINPIVAQTFGSTLTSPSGLEANSFLSSPSRESPHPSSPRDYFSAPQTTSPPTYTDSADLAPFPRRSPSTSRPTTPSSIRAPMDYDHQRMRTYSAAGNQNHNQRAQELQQTPRASSRPGSANDQYPSRSSSRNDTIPRFAGHSSTADSDDVRRSAEGRRPPRLNLPIGDGVRPQRSFDDRSRASPPPSLRPLRNSRSSLGTAGTELEITSRPPSIPTPTSPAHFADVPHGIESGTDTEAESEEYVAPKEPTDTREMPPALPPKDLPSAKSSTRPPMLRLDTADISRDVSDTGHSEEGITESPESSPVERTSHATFIAPALPPIRISMGGTDFSELLRSVGGNVMKLEQLAESTEEGGRKLDLSLTSPPSSIASRRDSVQMLTPRSDITITGSADLNLDDTPGRSSSSHQREPFVETSNMLDSTSFASTLNAEMLSKFPAVPDVVNFGPEATVESALVENSSVMEREYSRSSIDSSSYRRNPSEVTQITVTAPDNASPETLRARYSDSIQQQLREQISIASAQHAANVTLDLDLAQTLLRLFDEQREEFHELKRRLDGIKRASQQYMDGLTVAQTEYDRELKARRDAEAEVTRLRVLLSGQAVRLSAISADSKRQEAQKQLSEELSTNLSNLGRSLSKLKVERDMTLAEVEQLSASKSSATPVDEDGAVSLTRALSMRFDNIKNQYQHELVPLTEQRETLMMEINELKASRDAFLEETTMLNARNEELAQLNAQYVRRLEAAGLDSSVKQNGDSIEGSDMSHDKTAHNQSFTSSVTSSTVAFTEESAESKFIKISKPDSTETPTPQFRPPKFIKWPGHKTPKENAPMVWPKGRKEHVFQQISVLRPARCDHCGDKMWGSQLRCTNCSIAVHTRCIHQVPAACTQQSPSNREDSSQPLAPLPPSMFGRDLIEQVRAESRDEPRLIPIIVEKCIDAVEALALDLEGIYRKTGGSSQVKMITQLFERGNYHSFDLRDTDRFNDICSVTSVLKSYLRGLPDPLLTYALHEKLTSAAHIPDPAVKSQVLTDVINELPKEHYHTTRALMLHLYKISQHSDSNRMNARNLGVVFGPTLMRSRSLVNEFGDMGGSTLCMEWLIENAPVVFEHPPSFA